MWNIKPYISCDWYTAIIEYDKVRIITRENIDVMEERVFYLPKKITTFIMQQALPSPLPIVITTTQMEVGWVVDAICYSPDMKIGFLTLKNLYYITK